MKWTSLLLLTALACGPAQARDFVFEGVNLVTMETEDVLAGRTVIVLGNRIASIHTAEALPDYPEDARIIQAQGLYLMPGLAEMHAHVPPRRRGEQHVADVLNLYLVNGITTIRGMLGEAWHLELRAALADGRWSGPRLLTSGPSLNGRSVSSAQQAATMVRAQQAAGYDFVKLHPGLERDEYLALVDAAREVGIDFAGHVSDQVGVELTLSSGQATIDHLDGYAQLLVPQQHELHGQAPEFFGVNLAVAMQARLAAPLAEATAAAGVWNVPTQSLLENILYAQDLAQLMARPEMAYVSRQTAERWRAQVENFHSRVNRPAADNFLDARRALIGQLQRAGAGLLLGSDAPQIMNVPGFSIHEELGYLVAAGLSPYQALASGTRNVARFFDENDRGAIAPGYVADLVLLRGNPLADVSQTRQVVGVMRNGHWYDSAWIAATLEAIRSRGI